MEFQEVVNQRKMIRSFEKKPIPQEILEIILRNTFSGPSAGFSQGIEAIVLVSEEDKERYYGLSGSKEERKERQTKWTKLENAAVILIILSHKDTYLDRYAEPDKGWTDRDEARWPVPFWDIDAGMAGLLALLTVVDQGLGAVFTGVFPQETFKEEFKVPTGYNAVGAILIGYPADKDPKSPSLKRGWRNLDDVVHYGNWSK